MTELTPLLASLLLAVLCVLQNRSAVADRVRADERYQTLVDTQNAERRDWFVERSELTARIQHPDVFVPPAQSPLAPPAREAAAPEDDELALVGTILPSVDDPAGDV